MKTESHEPETELTPVLSEALSEACPESVETGSEAQLDELIALLRSDPQALAQVVSQMCPDDVRKDGWTPFNRRLFLQVLSETGRVSLGCDYTGLTRQSAYALRARDPLFAAGWDAACELARAPLADALYERAMDGTTDTITRDGEVVATRHRHDSRLSIAVLHRLDKRCDRAEERGAHHLALVRRWDDWLRLVGKGEEEAAMALLEAGPGQNAQHCQLRQLPLGENPTAEDREAEEDEGLDLSDRCWKDHHGWLTNFPPPAGFDGYESGPYAGEDAYERACTAEEVAILEADEAADIAAGRAEEEALRDSWFAYLRDELDPSRHPGLDDRHATLSGRQCRSGHGPAFPSAAEEGTRMPDQVRHDELSSDPHRHPGFSPGSAFPRAPGGTQVPDQVRHDGLPGAGQAGRTRHDDSVSQPGPAFTSATEGESQTPPQDRARSDSARE